MAERWLKFRKGRNLSSEEIGHYCRILTAIAETINIQQALDELFGEVEKTPMDFRPPNTVSGNRLSVKK